MKKFFFSLEAFLGEKNQEIEKIQKEMAPTVEKFNKIQEQSSKISRILSGGVTPGVDISYDYLQQLGEVYQQLQTEKKKAAEELHRWQEILSQKVKDKKVLEIIKEKRFREWKKNFNKKVEKNNEELILNYF